MKEEDRYTTESSGETRNSLRALSNKVRRSLGNSVQGADKVTAHLKRQDGGVNNADVGGTVYLEASVNNTALLAGHHGSGADGVKVGTVIALDIALPARDIIRISSDNVRAGTGLSSSVGGEGRGVVQLTDVLCDLDLLEQIPVQHEVVGVDDGAGGGVGTNVNAAAGEGEETPVFAAPGSRAGVDEDLGDGDLGLEDERPLQLKELQEVRGAGGVPVDGGDLCGVGGEGLLDLGSDLVGVVEDVGDGGVGDGGEGAVDAHVLHVEGEAVVHLVLEVLTDGGEVDDSLDAVLLQDVGAADTRELEEERGDEGPGGEDDLLVGLDDAAGAIGGNDLDAISGRKGSGVLPGELLGAGVQQDLQVGAVLVGVVVGAGGILTDGVRLVDGAGEDGEANHASAVDILVPRQTEVLERRVQDGGHGSVGLAVGPAGQERSVFAVDISIVRETAGDLARGLRSLKVLALEVVRKERIPVPALVSKLLPCVDLRGFSAGVGQSCKVLASGSSILN